LKNEKAAVNRGLFTAKRRGKRKLSCERFSAKLSLFRGLEIASAKHVPSKVEGTPRKDGFGSPVN